jgi:hypothetical protein
VSEKPTAVELKPIAMFHASRELVLIRVETRRFELLKALTPYLVN